MPSSKSHINYPKTVFAYFKFILWLCSYMYWKCGGFEPRPQSLGNHRPPLKCALYHMYTQHTLIHTHIHTHTHTHTHTLIHTHAHTHNTHILVCTHTTHIHLLMHAHIHTPRDSLAATVTGGSLCFLWSKLEADEEVPEVIPLTPLSSLITSGRLSDERDRMRPSLGGPREVMRWPVTCRLRTFFLVRFDFVWSLMLECRTAFSCGGVTFNWPSDSDLFFNLLEGFSTIQWVEMRLDSSLLFP